MDTTQNNKLWTRDFTIITLGSVVSMLGSAVSGFAISLLVLDYSQSTFLYVLFMVVYSLPRVVMPLISGPFLDRYSRKKVIYSLDFLSTALYTAFYFIVATDSFDYAILLAGSLILGTVDSVYQVAYESFYPTLISKGNFSKAYSVASLIFPLSAMMAPVAAIVYGKIGLAPLFAFNAVSFLIAGVVASYCGMNPKGGPKGVGDAVNLGVVLTFLLLFFANLILTAMYLQIVPPKGS